MRPLQAHCHRSLGTLYAIAGQREQARAALTAAIALYRTMDMAFWLPASRGSAGAAGGTVTWGKRPRRQPLGHRLAHLALDSRDSVVYNRRMAPGGGQAVGGAPLRPATSVIGVDMEDIP